MPSCSRRLLLLGALLSPAAGWSAEGSEESASVRIGLTPVFLDDQAAFLGVWREYLQQRLHTSVAFVRRGSYRQIVEMLQTGALDFAWLCGYPYVRHRQELRLLAVPLYRAKPLYQSYLIVPRADTATRSIIDLRGKVFAYSDPDSNSGYLYPQYALRQLKERPEAFFSRTFFTWSHRAVVEAVAVGLAQAGAVDGYVWDTLAKVHPAITRDTQVVQRSPEFGFPPFVARAAASGRGFAAMQEVLVGMARDPEGTALLKRLNLDGFTAGEPRLYDTVAAMVTAG